MALKKGKLAIFIGINHNIKEKKEETVQDVNAVADYLVDKEDVDDEN